MKINLKAIKGSVGEYGRVRRGAILLNISDTRAKDLIAGGAYAKATDDEVKAAGKTQIIDGLAPVKVAKDQAAPDFTKMKVDELKAYAKVNDIDLGEAKKRNEILAAIELASADAAILDPVFADMSDDELKAFAVEKSIDLGDATERADIIAAIELAREAAA